MGPMRTLRALAEFLEPPPHVSGGPSSARLAKQSAKTISKLGAPAAGPEGLRPPWLKKYWADRAQARKTGTRHFQASFDKAISGARGVLAREHGMELGERLGAGVGGAAFRHATHKGTVVKLDKGEREARLARHIMGHRELRKLSVLPKYHKVINTGVKDKATGETVHALHREDIPNLRSVDYGPWHKYGRAVSEMTERVAASGKPHHNYEELRRELDQHGARWRKEIPQKERQQFDRFHKGIHKLVQHGILPCDVHGDNIGSRANGQVVLRDAGCHHRVSYAR
jgi:hypothetical protein